MNPRRAGIEEGKVSSINNFTNKVTNQQKTFKKNTSTNRSQSKNNERVSSFEAVRNHDLQRKHLNAEKLVRERK